MTAFAVVFVRRDQCLRVLHRAYAKHVPQERLNSLTSLRISKECATPAQLDIIVLVRAPEGVASAQQGRSRLLAVQSALHVWATQLLQVLAAKCVQVAQQD